MSKRLMHDSDGNKLRLRRDGVFLKLANEKRTRKIISFRQGAVINFVKKKNLFQKGELVGFNYHALHMVLDAFPRMKDMLVRVGQQSYKVDPAEILDRELFLYFKNQGFERQVFFPLAEMRKINKASSPPAKSV